MSRNVSGVYSLPPGSVIANGETSDAADLNTPLADIASDLNIARPIVAGGTGSTSASAARTAFGLAIGTNVQAYNANLASLSGLTLAANKGLYSTGANTVAMFDLTAAARTFVAAIDAAAQRTTLGLGTAAVADVVDEDDMATDSATRPPSQQSVKAYVDASGGGIGFDPDAEWQAVTRSNGVTYQNTTDYAIAVSFRGSTGGTLAIGTASPPDQTIVNWGSGFGVLPGIVMPGHYYRITIQSGSQYELRAP